MSKEKAMEETMRDCQVILDRAALLIEDFIFGKTPENYGSTKLARELAAETGMNLSLVAPLVSIYIKRDNRVESNRGRHKGGLSLTDAGKAYRDSK